jgi:hypothetical protein
MNMFAPSSDTFILTLKNEVYIDNKINSLIGKWRVKATSMKHHIYPVGAKRNSGVYVRNRGTELRILGSQE